MWLESFGLLALLALPFTTSHINRSGSSCVPSLNVPPNTQTSTTEGQAVILRCPVQSCSNELPNVTWCRVQEEAVCEALTSVRGVFSEWEDNVHVLQLVPAHRNNSGYYRCSAEYGEQRITGNLIKVNVIGAHEHVTRDTSKTWMTYASIALRLSMTVVFYTFIYSYLRQVKGNKVSNSKSISSKMKYVPPSKAGMSIKHHTSYHHPVDRDPPTDSFEMICDDLDTSDDKLNVE
ncbi:B- and T-lymphocyte attenuator-like [Eleutherodactylus coqui]|uniref:B- and T-lymphocyte attenuator-like n=1 Tax=Eleutherodactylus coqui TaxID=57060 RepID=UPI00346260E7